MGWVLSQWAGSGNPEPINSQAWGYFPSWCSSHLLSISLFICLSQQAWNTFVLTHLCQLAASSSMSFPGGWVGAARWLGPTSGGGGALGEILAWARTHRGSFTSGYFYFLALHISASARESDSQVSWKDGHWIQVPLHEDWTGLRQGERYRTHSLCMLIPEGLQANVILRQGPFRQSRVRASKKKQSKLITARTTTMCKETLTKTPY